MQEIRLGTIGSGFIVHYILDVVKQVEGIRCVAAYSRTEEKSTFGRKTCALRETILYKARTCKGTSCFSKGKRIVL